MTIDRRNFLRSSAAITAGVSILPHLISCSPNQKKLNVAIIGVGGRGKAQWSSCLNEEGVEVENVVALCDVDDNRAREGYLKFPSAKKYKDFRKMFDEMGNQGHATDGIRRVKEWYDAGIVGEVKEVLAWFDGPDFGPDKYFEKTDPYPPAEHPIPEWLDWDLWLGPAKYRPFNTAYVPKSWRGFYDFGNGELGDWACHTLDAPFWSLDLGMPTATDCLFNSGAPDGFLPDRSIIKFEFPRRGDKPAVNLTWYEGGLKPEIRPEWEIDRLPGSGMIMIGEKQNIITGGRPNNARLMMPDDQWEDWVKNEMPAPTIPRIDGGPQKEFLDAVKDIGPLPGSNFDYAAELTEMAAIGVLAQRFNTRIEYDAEKMKVTNHANMDQFVKEPVREGWEYGEEVWK